MEAISMCETCIQMNATVPDAYYKLAQAHTYLFLCECAEKGDIAKGNSEAKKYLAVLEIWGEDESDGYLFNKRNALEAEGKIEEANEINNLLRKNKRGDAEKMGKVYEKLLHCDN